jgi:cyclin-dependent kinases regulatory subunit 2
MNYGSQIDYSDKYYDEQYEYRYMSRRTLRFSHVTLPKELSKQIPSGQLLSEKEWRSLGIQMSLGWEHYATHKYILSSVTDLFRPEPNILLFRRPLGTNGQTGKVDPELAERQRRQFRKQYGLE